MTVTPSAHDSFTFTASDGLAIHARTWSPSPEVPARGIVQMHHGISEHIALYQPVAEFLTARGLIVYGSDHRGHGRSVASPTDLGYAADHNGFRQSVADMLQLTQRIKETHAGLPHILMGHSMGSLMCQQYMIDHGDQVDGVVLVSTFGPLGRRTSYLASALLRMERWLFGKRGRSRLVPRLTNWNKNFEPSRTRYDWLCSDPAVVDAYIEDPLCGAIASLQMLTDIMDARRYVSRPANHRRIPLDLPVYIIAGAMDPVHAETADLDALIEAYQAAGLTNISHKYYPGKRHQILEESNRTEVFDDLGSWVNEVFEASGR